MVTHKSAQAGRANHGFTLLEMLVSMAILLVVLSVVFEAMNKYQKRYVGQRRIISKTQDLRSAVSLMEQEISQAGSDLDIVRSLTSAVIGSATPQILPLDNTAGIYVGQKLRVDIGSSEEYLSVTSVSAGMPMAVISKSHSAGAPVATVGPFPTGVLSASTATVAKFYGAIYSTNDLNYVEYQYDPAAQTLCRSITPISAAAKAPCSVLLENVTAGSFAYDWQAVGGWTICKRLTVSLTVQTAQRDPETNGFVQQTAVGEISPRNLLAAFQLGSDGLANNLQAQPPSVPFP